MNNLTKIWVSCAAISASMVIGAYLGYHGGIQKGADERDNLIRAINKQNAQIEVFNQALDDAMLEFCIRDYRNEYRIEGESIKPYLACKEQLEK